MRKLDLKPFLATAGLGVALSTLGVLAWMSFNQSSLRLTHQADGYAPMATQILATPEGADLIFGTKVDCQEEGKAPPVIKARSWHVRDADGLNPYIFDLFLYPKIAMGGQPRTVFEKSVNGKVERTTVVSRVKNREWPKDTIKLVSAPGPVPSLDEPSCKVVNLAEDGPVTRLYRAAKAGASSGLLVNTGVGGIPESLKLYYGSAGSGLLTYVKDIPPEMVAQWSTDFDLTVREGKEASWTSLHLSMLSPSRTQAELEFMSMTSFKLSDGAELRVGFTNSQGRNGLDRNRVMVAVSPSKSL